MEKDLAYSVCHLTSVHKRTDMRIFYKECQTLNKNGFKISQIVADGLGDEQLDGVLIKDVGKPKNRMIRMLKTGWSIYFATKKIKANIYHFHDPELLLIGLLLRLEGHRVIYDVHEDLPRQLLGKAYLNKNFRKALSILIEGFENFAAKQMSGIIAATPFIRDRFLKINPNTIDINNFPILNGHFRTSSWQEKENKVCYVGAISAVRGVKEMVNSIKFVRNDVSLLLGGPFESNDLRTEVVNTPGWERVKELGFVNREQVVDVYAKSKAGLVVLHPTQSYLDSLPVKMFEYMLAEIPVIASDFPLWREIILQNDCGYCVDPSNPIEIAKVIDSILDNANEAERMGKNGKQAVLQKFNWGMEETKLLEFYERLLHFKQVLA